MSYWPLGGPTVEKEPLLPGAIHLNTQGAVSLQEFELSDEV